MKTLWILTLALFGFDPASAQDTPAALQQAFMDGMRANDADAMAACYEDDAVLYTLGSPRMTGPQSVREDWGAFFAQYRVLDADLFDMGMEVRDDLAVAWGRFGITAEPKAGGEPIRLTGRFTDVARNVDGRWRYVVDHVSPDPAPVDSEPQRE